MSNLWFDLTNEVYDPQWDEHESMDTIDMAADDWEDEREFWDEYDELDGLVNERDLTDIVREWEETYLGQDLPEMN